MELTDKQREALVNLRGDVLRCVTGAREYQYQFEGTGEFIDWDTFRALKQGGYVVSRRHPDDKHRLIWSLSLTGEQQAQEQVEPMR